MTTEKAILVGDLGGTNARFALARTTADGKPSYHAEQVLQCNAYESVEAAITDYLQATDSKSPHAICLAAAGPVIAGCVELTNNNWRLSEAGLHKRFDKAHVQLFNDFESVAYSLPFLGAAECLAIGDLPAPQISGDDWTLGVLGPGTGLGAASLACKQGRIFPLVTEAGHLGFAPENEQQKAVWEILRQRFGRVSDERLVSGMGIENIYQALTELNSASTTSTTSATAADIFAQAEQDDLAAQAVSLFTEALGQVAGNFALATGAFDGIFIAGGIVQRYPELLSNSNFRHGFENKGRHKHLMTKIPTALIRHEHPGLLGAAAFALQNL